MLFKWSGKTTSPASSDLTETDEASSSDVTDLASRRTDPDTPSDQALRISPSDLTRALDGHALNFETTADLTVSAADAGSDEGELLASFAAGPRAPDLNIFLMAQPGSKGLEAARHVLRDQAAAIPAPDDWAFVFNFAEPLEPRALRMPAGRGRDLAAGLEAALTTLQETLPRAFASEEYQLRRRGIEAEFPTSTDDVIRAMAEKAASQNVAMVRTPLGFSMAPMHDGRVVKPEVFKQLPEGMKREVEERISALQTELATVLKAAPLEEKARQSHIARLDQDIARHAVEAALDPLSEAFADCPEVATHLAALENDLVTSAIDFVAACPTQDGQGRSAQTTERALDNVMSRYLVLALVSHDADTGAPFCEDLDPRPASLLGHAGSPRTTTRTPRSAPVVSPGLLHKCNGGFLLLDAASLVEQPSLWQTLKAALKSQRTRFHQPADLMPGTLRYEPASVPLDLKAVLVGAQETYASLAARDPEFSKLFTCCVDAEPQRRYLVASDDDMVALVAEAVRAHDLMPFSVDAVALLVTRARRIAARDLVATLPSDAISDLVRHADHRARQDGSDVVAADHVAAAAAARDQSEANRAAIQQTDPTTTAAQIGHVVSLAYARVGTSGFPSVVGIGARTHAGRGRASELVRTLDTRDGTSECSVQPLWSFISGQFGQSGPLSLAGTILHHADGHARGDLQAAAAAEVIALFSSLADVTIRQDLAITGGVDLWGNLLPVPAINERIEAFYEACQQRGLSGSQGVIIPQRNIPHVILQGDVLKSIEEKWFSIYAVSSVDEAFTLLSGQDAGLMSDGAFSVNGTYAAIADRLQSYVSPAGGLPQRTLPPKLPQQHVDRSSVDRTDGRAA